MVPSVNDAATAQMTRPTAVTLMSSASLIFYEVAAPTGVSTLPFYFVATFFLQTSYVEKSTHMTFTLRKHCHYQHQSCARFSDMLL